MSGKVHGKSGQGKGKGKGKKGKTNIPAGAQEHQHGSTDASAAIQHPPTGAAAAAASNPGKKGAPKRSRSEVEDGTDLRRAAPRAKKRQRRFVVLPAFQRPPDRDSDDDAMEGLDDSDDESFDADAEAVSLTAFKTALDNRGLLDQATNEWFRRALEQCQTREALTIDLLHSATDHQLPHMPLTAKCSTRGLVVPELKAVTTWMESQQLLLLTNLSTSMTTDDLTGLFKSLQTLFRAAGQAEGVDSPLIGLALHCRVQRKPLGDDLWFCTDKYWCYGIVVLKSQEAAEAVLAHKTQGAVPFKLRRCVAEWPEPEKWFLLTARLWKPAGSFQQREARWRRSTLPPTFQAAQDEDKVALVRGLPRYVAASALGSWLDAISGYGVWSLWFRPKTAQGRADEYGYDCVVVFHSRTARARAFFLFQHPSFRWLQTSLQLLALPPGTVGDFVASSKDDLDVFLTPDRGGMKWAAPTAPKGWKANPLTEIPEHLMVVVRAAVAKQRAVVFKTLPFSGYDMHKLLRKLGHLPCLVWAAEMSSDVDVVSQQEVGLIVTSSPESALYFCDWLSGTTVQDGTRRTFQDFPLHAAVTTSIPPALLENRAHVYSARLNQWEEYVSREDMNKHVLKAQDDQRLLIVEGLPTDADYTMAPFLDWMGDVFFLVHRTFISTKGWEDKTFLTWKESEPQDCARLVSRLAEGRVCLKSPALEFKRPSTAPLPPAGSVQPHCPFITMADLEAAICLQGKDMSPLPPVYTFAYDRRGVDVGNRYMAEQRPNLLYGAARLFTLVDRPSPSKSDEPEPQPTVPPQDPEAAAEASSLKEGPDPELQDEKQAQLVTPGEAPQNLLARLSSLEMQLEASMAREQAVTSELQNLRARMGEFQDLGMALAAERSLRDEAEKQVRKYQANMKLEIQRALDEALSRKQREFQEEGRRAQAAWDQERQKLVKEKQEVEERLRNHCTTDMEAQAQLAVEKAQYKKDAENTAEELQALQERHQLTVDELAQVRGQLALKAPAPPDVQDMQRQLEQEKQMHDKELTRSWCEKRDSTRI